MRPGVWKGLRIHQHFFGAAGGAPQNQPCHVVAGAALQIVERVAIGRQRGDARTGGVQRGDRVRQPVPPIDAGEHPLRLVGGHVQVGDEFRLSLVFHPPVVIDNRYCTDMIRHGLIGAACGGAGNAAAARHGQTAGAAAASRTKALGRKKTALMLTT